MLIDLFLEILAGAAAPSSERGLVATFGAASAIAAIGAWWAASSAPQSAAALGALAGSLLVGAACAFIALLHWSRNRSDVWFSAVSTAIGLGAIAVPLIRVWRG